MVAPQSDPGQIQLRFQGATARLAANGDLLLPTANGTEMRFDKPVAYQEIDGKRFAVDAAFTLTANNDVRFALGQYDHARELLIDPTLVFLGTLGTGVNQVDVNGMTVDSSGAMYLIGTTNDSTFPATPGAFQTVCGPSNATAAGAGTVYCQGGNNTSAFITKISADGTKLVYSTYLSGHGGLEQGDSIAVDASGVAYLFGTSGSDDFPVTSDAFQKRCYSFYGAFNYPNPAPCDGFYNGGGTEYTINNEDAFFAKLNATGSSLLYASYLGGVDAVYPSSIGLDGTGNIYLYGQTTNRGVNEQGGGALQYTGLTSSGFQLSSTAITTGNSTGAGNYNIDIAPFLSKFSNDGHTLLYGTFFDDNVNAASMYPTAMAVSSAGTAYIAGYSSAINQNDTAGTLKTACTEVNPGSPNCTTTDGFVAAIDTTKSGTASLLFATRIGGTDAAQGSNTAEQQVLGITLDGSSNIYITGFTEDHTFPVGTGGYQATCPNYLAGQSYDYCDSAFVLKINSTATTVLAGSFLVGPNFRSSPSVGYNVRLDSKGQIYLYGLSDDGGGDFPQVNPVQPTYQGGNKLFISTFTADLSKLIFSTRFGNPTVTNQSVKPAGGLALDPSDNIYFTGTTNETSFGTTTGTYVTQAATGEGDHVFFAKLTKVLQPTATTLTPPAAVTVGKSLTLKASVVGTLQTTPVATGTVTFTYTSPVPVTVGGTATLDATGTATLTTTAPATAGSYTVIATYNGDGTYDVSTSSSVMLTVNNVVTPKIVLATSASTGKPDTKFTFTATLTSTSGTPTGTVYFIDGTTMLGSSVLAGGVASYSTTLPVGTHSITARYGGDATFSTITSSAQGVSVTTYAPSVTLTTSAASVVVGKPLTLSVTVATAGTALVPSGKITFLDGTTVLGTETLASGTASYTTNTLGVGVHTLMVSYAGDSNFAAATSSALTQTIVAASVILAAAPPSLTVNSGSSGIIKITATPDSPLAGSVSFACGSLPSHASCSFSPSTLTYGNSTAAQTTSLSFNTNVASLDVPAFPFHGRSNLSEIVAAGVFLPLGLLGFSLRRRRGVHLASRLALFSLVLVATAAIVGLTGCGYSGSADTPKGSYTIPVTATVNGITSSVSITLTVQ